MRIELVCSREICLIVIDDVEIRVGVGIRIDVFGEEETTMRSYFVDALHEHFDPAGVGDVAAVEGGEDAEGAGFGRFGWFEWVRDWGRGQWMWMWLMLG